MPGVLTPLSCDECSLRQNPAFIPLTRNELCFIAHSRQGNTTIRRGSELIDLRPRHRQTLTLTKGWACQYMIGPDGNQSIRDFLLPGDWVYLDPAQFESTRLSGVRAITDVEVCVLSYAEMSHMLDSQPDLTRKLLHTLYVDRRRLDRRHAAFARATASRRAAYLFLELQDRTRALGLGGADWFHFPVRRQHLEDTLDLSHAQLSRALSSLRDAGLATFERGIVKIKNRAELETLSGYSSLPDAGRLLL